MGNNFEIELIEKQADGTEVKKGNKVSVEFVKDTNSNETVYRAGKGLGNKGEYLFEAKIDASGKKHIRLFDKKGELNNFIDSTFVTRDGDYIVFDAETISFLPNSQIAIHVKGKQGAIQTVEVRAKEIVINRGIHDVKILNQDKPIDIEISEKFFEDISSKKVVAKNLPQQMFDVASSLNLSGIKTKTFSIKEGEIKLLTIVGSKQVFMASGTELLELANVIDGCEKKTANDLHDIGFQFKGTKKAVKIEKLEPKKAKEIIDYIEKEGVNIEEVLPENYSIEIEKASKLIIENKSQKVGLQQTIIDAGNGGNGGNGGQDGKDGRNLKLQVENGFIQWQLEGDSNWQNLVALSDITGPQGLQGPAGQNGLNGINGKNIELQATADYIQWRYLGENWQNLVSLDSIRGKDGETKIVYFDGKDEFELKLSELGDKLNQVVTDFQKRTAELEKSQKELENRIDDTNKRTEELENKLKANQKEIKELNERYEHLIQIEDNSGDLQKQIDELNNQIANLEKENKEIIKNSIATKQDIVNLQEEIENLKSGDNNTNNFDELSKKIKDCEDKFNNFVEESKIFEDFTRNEVSKLQSNQSKLESELKIASNKIISLDDKIKELLEKQQNLESTIISSNKSAPELKVENEEIQWRGNSEEEWQKLVSLDQLKGEKGENGKDGEKGEQGEEGKDGENGKSIEIQKTDDLIQYRLEGETEWKKLLSKDDKIFEGFAQEIKNYVSKEIEQQKQELEQLKQSAEQEKQELETKIGNLQKEIQNVENEYVKTSDFEKFVREYLEKVENNNPDNIEEQPEQEIKKEKLIEEIDSIGEQLFEEEKTEEEKPEEERKEENVKQENSGKPGKKSSKTSSVSAPRTKIKPLKIVKHSILAAIILGFAALTTLTMLGGLLAPAFMFLSVSIGSGIIMSSELVEDIKERAKDKMQAAKAKEKELGKELKKEKAKSKEKVETKEDNKQIDKKVLEDEIENLDEILKEEEKDKDNNLLEEDDLREETDEKGKRKKKKQDFKLAPVDVAKQRTYAKKIETSEAQTVVQTGGEQKKESQTIKQDNIKPEVKAKKTSKRILRKTESVAQAAAGNSAYWQANKPQVQPQVQQPVSEVNSPKGQDQGPEM